MGKRNRLARITTSNEPERRSFVEILESANIDVNDNAQLEDYMKSRGFSQSTIRRAKRGAKQFLRHKGDRSFHFDNEGGFRIFDKENNEITQEGKASGNRTGFGLGDLVGVGNNVSAFAGVVRDVEKKLFENEGTSKEFKFTVQDPRIKSQERGLIHDFNKISPTTETITDPSDISIPQKKTKKATVPIRKSKKVTSSGASTEAARTDESPKTDITGDVIQTEEVKTTQETKSKPNIPFADLSKDLSEAMDNINNFDLRRLLGFSEQELQDRDSVKAVKRQENTKRLKEFVNTVHNFDLRELFGVVPEKRNVAQEKEE